MNTPVIPEMFRSTAAQVREQGWVIEQAGGHLRWISPDGTAVTSSCTPSDCRALPRHVSKLRQAGAVIDGRGAASTPETVMPTGPPEPKQASELVCQDQPPEVAELRELISEARAVLGDLQRERKASEALVAADVHELVASEVARALKGPLRDAEQTQAEMLERFDADAKAALDDARRSFRARMGEANELIMSLRTRLSADIAGAVPSAFCRGRAS
jgi:hypothetical protein